MTQEEILSELNTVFVDVFNRPGLVVHAGTTAEDVPGWDSLSHTVLIARIEKRFKVKFSLREILKLQNVGDMCALIGTRLG